MIEISGLDAMWLPSGFTKKQEFEVWKPALYRSIFSVPQNVNA